MSQPAKKPAAANMGPRGGRGPHGMMPGEKAKDFKGSMKRIISYMGSYKAAFLLVLLLASISTLFTILGPRMLGNATTLIFSGVVSAIEGNNSFDFSAIVFILVRVLILYGLSYLFSLFMGWKMAKITTDLTYRMRKDISEKMNHIPFSYFDKTTHGDVMSRMTNDVDVINQTLSQSLTQILTSSITVIGVLIMMFSINLWMTLTAMLIIPASMGMVKFIVKRSQKHFRQQQGVLGQLNGHVEEMYSGHQVMKLFNGEEKSIKTFQGLNEKLYDSAWKSQFLSGLMMPLMGFIGNLGYVAVAITGSWLTLHGMIMVGDIQAFIQYIRNFTFPLTAIANISNVLQQTAAAAERIFALLDVEEEEDNADSFDIAPDETQGTVEFRNVQFGYDPEAPVIKNFSAKVQPGQKVAIVGPTGAGKTTMVKLLMRFYDIQKGEILVDGIDIRKMKRKDLRRHFAMVLQDTWLYNDSVKENIRLGKMEASDKEVIQAAETAHADHFILTQPEGYEMQLNEETSNISQGQKQLLTIARAVLPEPRFLILDEATSSVDTRTEELIQKAMDNVMQNRTSFIIAHRLSTIRNADLILVMDKGDIVEQGTHKELLHQNGFYAELYNSQFEPVESY